MLTITVKNQHVNKRSGTSAKGRDYTIYTQEAMAECDRFRQVIKLTLDDEGTPVPNGVYHVNFDACLEVTQYGELRFGRQLALTSIDAKPAKAA